MFRCHLFSMTRLQYFNKWFLNEWCTYFSIGFTFTSSFFLSFWQIIHDSFNFSWITYFHIFFGMIQFLNVIFTRFMSSYKSFIFRYDFSQFIASFSVMWLFKQMSHDSFLWMIHLFFVIFTNVLIILASEFLMIHWISCVFLKWMIHLFYCFLKWWFTFLIFWFK